MFEPRRSNRLTIERSPRFTRDKGGIMMLKTSALLRTYGAWSEARDLFREVDTHGMRKRITSKQETIIRRRKDSPEVRIVYKRKG